MTIFSPVSRAISRTASTNPSPCKSYDNSRFRLSYPTFITGGGEGKGSGSLTETIFPTTSISNRYSRQRYASKSTTRTRLKWQVTNGCSAVFTHKFTPLVLATFRNNSPKGNLPAERSISVPYAGSARSNESNRRPIVSNLSESCGGRAFTVVAVIQTSNNAANHFFLFISIRLIKATLLRRRSGLVPPIQEPTHATYGFPIVPDRPQPPLSAG